MKCPIRFKDVIVITTKELAKVYNCDENNIIKNFNLNESKFKIGKHYYKLDGEELKEFKRLMKNSNEPLYEEIKFAPKLYLWTHKGASRHCKMLGTDEAWEQFDILEENYFNPKVPRLSRKEELQLTILNGNELEKVSSLKEYEILLTQPLIEENKRIKDENKHKQDVINALVYSVPLAEKRQRVNQIVRYGGENITDRWRYLYSEFNMKHHKDVGRCAKNRGISIIEYVDRELGMIEELYVLAVKLFESNVDALLETWKNAIGK